MRSSEFVLKEKIVSLISNASIYHPVLLQVYIYIYIFGGTTRIYAWGCGPETVKNHIPHTTKLGLGGVRHPIDPPNHPQLIGNYGSPISRVWVCVD